MKFQHSRNLCCSYSPLFFPLCNFQFEQYNYSVLFCAFLIKYTHTSNIFIALPVVSLTSEANCVHCCGLWNLDIGFEAVCFLDRKRQAVDSLSSAGIACKKCVTRLSKCYFAFVLCLRCEVSPTSDHQDQCKQPQSQLSVAAAT